MLVHLYMSNGTLPGKFKTAVCIDLYRALADSVWLCSLWLGYM